METDEEGTLTFLERERMHEEVEVNMSGVSPDVSPLSLDSGAAAGRGLSSSSLLPPADGGVEEEARDASYMRFGCRL